MAKHKRTSPAAAEQMWSHWNTLDDWQGYCRSCGEKRIGRLKEFGVGCDICNGGKHGVLEGNDKEGRKERKGKEVLT